MADTISSAHLATGRAVDQLRRQLGIIYQPDKGALVGACPIEGLTPGLLAAFKGPFSLLLTGARARSLGLNAPGKMVRIDTKGLTLPMMQALADPILDAEKLPALTILPSDSSHEMLLTLTKYASLLPALLLVEGKDFPSDWLRVTESDLRTYWAAPSLDMVPVAEAKLPIEGAEDAKLACFRMRYGTSIHLALTIGKPGKTPLVRVHSSCITGDLLGSLRCDCGDQLKLAMEKIRSAGGGILIYLHQEGRGIGIANKLRAYALQERGVDTYEANLMLGFDEDERDFSIAAAILKKLNATTIRLLTNNPQKMAAIEKTGIKIAERVPLAAAPGKHNHGYLDAKSKKAGHWV